MKHLHSVHLQPMHIIVLVVIGLLAWPAAAELTAYQSMTSSADVGQTVMVTVILTYNGQNATQATVTPSPPSGVVANGGGGSIDLSPGVTQSVSYPVTALESGSYWVVSDITWEEDGTWRSLSLEAPFNAVAGTETKPQDSTSGAGSSPDMTDSNGGIGQGSDPFAGPTTEGQTVASGGNSQKYPPHNGTSQPRISQPGTSEQGSNEMPASGDHSSDMPQGEGESGGAPDQGAEPPGGGQ